MTKMIKLHQHLTKLLVPLAVVAGLAACTTTTTGDLGERNPNAARDAYIQLGEEYLKVDDRESAKQRFFRAIEIDDDAAGAYTGLAVVYLRSTEYEEAEEYFKKALRADSNYTPAKVQYGVFLLGQARYREACSQLQRSTEDREWTQRHVALFYYGRCEFKRENFDEAERALMLANRINVRFAPSYLELTQVYLAKNELPLAKSTLSEYFRFGAETAEALLVAIQVERAFGNLTAERTFAQQLQLRYPYSDEWLAYREMSNQ